MHPHDDLCQPVPELLAHFAWEYLDRESLATLCKAIPILSVYGKCRNQAISMSCNKISLLRKSLDHSIPSSAISSTRSQQLAHLLLLCDFNVGLLIRTLGGNYTSEFLDYSTIDACLAKLATIPSGAGEPKHNFKLLHHLFHNHVPFQANFRCSRQDTLARNKYNNHQASDPHLPSIRQKTAQDVQKSYSIALPRWTLHFLNGLFLAAIGYATREVKGKIKGRPVNDPSALITGPLDSGALNSHISCKDPLSMPPVHYQSALQRLWKRIYNLRITQPNEDIIVYKDDLVSAFRRLRYHPDIATAYSFVLDSFLIIPIGMVFGARDAPSLFCLLSELRSFASRHASSLPLSQPTSSMIDSVVFQSPPPPASALTSANKDALNPGISGSFPGHQPTFVDDTIMAEIRSTIRAAAQNSVLTASLFVGHHSLVEEPISLEKFEKFFFHINETLGFVTNSRSLTASYPADKKDSITKLLQSSTWKPKSRQPVKLLARILGKIRHVAQILPFGSHLSIHLQLCLSRHVIQTIKKSPSDTPFKALMKKAWNPYATTHISAAAAHDLQNLTTILLSDDPSIWSRPLSLLIPITPHFIGQSDACNMAMGGLCFSLKFQWRLPNNVFHDLPSWSHTQPDSPQLHINIHEFIAIIINAFFMMHSFIHLKLTSPSSIPNCEGWSFSLQADNTSALSWMRHLSRSRDKQLTQLCHFFSQLTFAFNSLHTSRFDGTHLPGKLNIHADALSRPQLHPTYNSLFHTYPEMQSLPAYRVPQQLISVVNACLWRRLTREMSSAAIDLLTSSRLSSFQLGAPNWESRILPYQQSRKSTEKEL